MCFINLVFTICCVRGVDDQAEPLRENNISIQDKETGDIFHQDLYRGVNIASNVGVNISKQRMERIQKQSNCDITQSIEPTALTSAKQRENHLNRPRLWNQSLNEECVNDSSPLISR
jgi:hypothetical protein